jgi:leader peptidase (prepilin peptidase)/N-methyltransferase
MTDPVVFAVVAAVFGAIVGSFLNVVIWRTGVRLDEEFAAEEGRAPVGKVRSAQFGSRSICPACGAPIPFHYNLPVAGWLLLRGRAACCRTPISPRYPFVEALTAALFAGLVFLVDASPFGATPTAAAIAFVAFAFFTADLIANTFIDFDYRILPDRLTRPLLVVGLVAGFALGPDFAGGLPESFVSRISPYLAGLLASGIGAAAGWALTFGIRALGSAAFGQEAMGLGDVKLMTGVGAFLGWPGALLTFFLGSLIGAVAGLLGRAVGFDTHRIAFGPYLATGAVLTLFGGRPLMYFVSHTLPEWQARVLADPFVAGGVLVACAVLLVWIVRRGRSRRSEES